MVDVDPNIIDTTPVFWTSGIGPKLWSPGRWNINLLKESGLAKLSSARSAFNAKPDMLLLCPAGAVRHNEARSEAGRVPASMQLMAVNHAEERRTANEQTKRAGAVDGRAR